MSIAAPGDQNTSLPSTVAWQLWGLVKQELLFLSWALMDVAIIAPLALLVMRWARFWNVGLMALWLLLLILLPFNLIRLMSAREITQSRQRRIILIALIATLLVSWRGLLYAPRALADFGWLGEFAAHLGDIGNPQWGRDFLVFLFAIVCWWRGLRLTQLTPDIQSTGFRLRLGVLLLAPIGLILYQTGNLWGATPFVLLYFLTGLTAVALIRAEQIERERSGFAASLTPRWVLTIFATSLLVVLFSGLLAALVSGEAARLMSGRLTPLWTAALVTLAVSLSTVVFLLTPLLNLASLLITLLADIFANLFAVVNIPFDPAQGQDQEALQALNELLSEGQTLPFALPPLLIRGATALLMFAVAALVVTFLTRFFRQPPAGMPPGGVAVDQLTSREAPQSLSERILDRLGLFGRWRTAASIRRIYNDMCLAASGAGFPRGTAETPYEYLATLQALWPENPDDCQRITEAYVQVRYGEIPETTSELQSIREAWERLAARRGSEANLFDQNGFRGK